MENAGIFYGHLEWFTVIWYFLCPFGSVVVIWYIFPRFGTLCQEKSGSPAPAFHSFLKLDRNEVLFPYINSFPGQESRNLRREKSIKSGLMRHIAKEHQSSTPPPFPSQSCTICFISITPLRIRGEDVPRSSQIPK
jgi:hypothetical protein